MKEKSLKFCLVHFVTQNVPVALVTLDAVDFLQLEQKIQEAWSVKHLDKLSLQLDHARDHDLILNTVRTFMKKRVKMVI